MEGDIRNDMYEREMAEYREQLRANPRRQGESHRQYLDRRNAIRDELARRYRDETINQLRRILALPPAGPAGPVARVRRVLTAVADTIPQEERNRQSISYNNTPNSVCGICLDPLGGDVNALTSCCQSGHVYHEACIDDWLRTGQTTCPICRSHIRKNPVIYNTELGHFEGQGKMTIKSIKAHLKKLKIKGITGKTKAQLIDMLPKKKTKK